MNNRQQLLPHHEIKAEIGINVIDDILNIFNESACSLPRKIINIVENTIHEARQKAVAKYQEAQGNKEKSE